jgi:hypothetical protein
MLGLLGPASPRTEIYPDHEKPVEKLLAEVVQLMRRTTRNITPWGREWICREYDWSLLVDVFKVHPEHPAVQAVWAEVRP